MAQAAKATSTKWGHLTTLAEDPEEVPGLLVKPAE
jgi:hypothetical protein